MEINSILFNLNYPQVVFSPIVHVQSEVTFLLSITIQNPPLHAVIILFIPKRCNIGSIERKNKHKWLVKVGLDLERNISDGEM